MIVRLKSVKYEFPDQVFPIGKFDTAKYLPIIRRTKHIVALTALLQKTEN